MRQNRTRAQFGAPNGFTRLTTAIAYVVIAMILIPVYGCESTGNKKDRAIMQKQITSIDERVGFVYKNAKAQADVAANLNQLQNAITTLTGQIEELNARSQVLSGRIDSVDRGSSSRRILENAKSANIRLEKINERLQILSANVLAFINLMEKKSGISQSRHRKAVKAIIDSGRLDEMFGAEDSEKRKNEKKSAVREWLTPEDLYQRAYGAYLRGAYDEAISGFAEYLKRYPQTDLSDNAAYWIGEAHYGKTDYGSAYKAFDDMAENYSRSNKAPSALLKSANAMIKLNNKKAAYRRLKLIVERYPTSNEAILASERLEEAARAGAFPERSE